MAAPLTLRMGGPYKTYIGFKEPPMTDTHADKAALTAWYLETIGYDPFQDDPEITVEDVRRTKAEYLAETGQ